MGFFLNDCPLRIEVGERRGASSYSHGLSLEGGEEASIVTVSTDWVAIKRTREVRFSCCPSHCK